MRKRIISKSFAILLTAVLTATSVTPVFASDDVEKEETVYVKTDSNGNEKSIIVSDWLKNFTSEKEIKDATDLTDIENVKGNETFSRGKNHKITWSANGNDIYYQGNSNKSLPVTMKVTYYLDGKKISPAKLVGKSGKIKIHYSYTNHSKIQKTIQGKSTTVYTPFTMVTAAILNTDHFSNVKVSNGKVISDGNKHIVIGVAMPGLSKSLNLDQTSLGDAFDLPEDFEITADAKDFQMSVTATVATANTLSELGLDHIDSFDELTSSLHRLEDASNQLVDGSRELVEGVEKLSSASKELKAGTSKLSKSSKDLSSGLNQLANGSADLKNGTSQLASKTRKLPSSVQELDSGIKQIINQLKNSVPDENSQEKLQQNLQNAQKEVTAELTNIKTQTEQIGSSTQNIGVCAQSIGTSAVHIGSQAEKIGSLAQDENIPAEQRQQLASIAGALAQDADSLGNHAKTIGNNVSSIGSSATSIGNSLKQTQTDLQVIAASLGNIQKLLTATKNSTAKLQSALQQISAGTSRLLASSRTLTSSIGQLNAGASTLNNGLTSASKGGKQLSAGASTLDNGTGKLVIGISQLQSGASTLNQGMITFHNDGIKKLTDTINGDLQETLDRANAVVDAGNDYQTFTQKAGNAKGSVKFMIETEEIEK